MGLRNQSVSGLDADVWGEDSLMAFLDDEDDEAFTRKWNQLQAEHERHRKQLESKPKVNDSLALSDPQWELIDPTPNVHVLFIEFNQRFFWNKLGSVELVWSKRMTTCAGICYYSGRRSGYCRIGLSEPLLKLRSRKELVETLIHEMIHAYLFVTHNNRDHDGHGPEFHKHMYRINGETGLAISVYHTFHDEVSHYKRHWWRCEGPCRNRRPFFGYVKRATNRAPSKNDLWWADHQRDCGGKFIKVKEPEEYTEKQKQAELRKQAKLNGTKSVRTSAKSVKTTKKETDIRALLKSPSCGSNLSQSLSTQTQEASSSKSCETDLLGFTEPPQTSFTDEPTTNDWVLNSGASFRKIVVNNRRLNDATLPLSSTFSANKQSSSISEVIDLVDNDVPSCSFANAERSVACPVCGIHVSETSINLHLDSCLSR